MRGAAAASWKKEAQSAEQAHSALSAPRPRLVTDLALLLLLGLIGSLICFSNLDSFSIRDWDEATHVLAVQNMYQGGHWLSPRVEGEQYFNKPPLKMWLSALSVLLLGDSNFSWRLLDATAGVLSGILVYVFALLLFHSRLAAVIAACSLFSFRGYLFEHSVRMAVQDSALVLLSLAALLLLWIGLAPHRLPHITSRQKRGALLLAGLCTGAALLTKNLSGLFPLAVIGLSLFCTGLLFRERRLQKLVAVGVAAAACAAAYMLPHCLLSQGACATFFGFEVWERVTDGYHNTENPWLYWELLFTRGYSFEPMLLAALLLFACVHAAKRDPRYLLLLCWTVPPFVALSFAASRLPWYIAPLYPGIALLLAGPLAFCIRQLHSSRRRSVQGICAMAVVLCSVYVAVGVAKSYAAVTQEKERFAFDHLREALRPFQGAFEVRSFEMPPTAMRERPYLRAFAPQLSELPSLATIQEQHQRPLLVLTQIASLPRLFDTRLPQGYWELPPFAERQMTIVALWYAEKNTATPVGFERSKMLVDFGQNEVPLQFGWKHAGSFASLAIRNTSGSRAALNLDADAMFARRNTTLFLNAARLSEAGAHLAIYLNERLLTKVVLGRSLATVECDIPAGSFEIGRNQMTFVLDDPRARMMANWLSIQLR